MKNIWTNGCFDIVHIGHIRLFEYAKSLGDHLYVGIDSDKRIKEYKGSNRPFNNQNDRKSFLASIKFIQHVEIFESDTELECLIKKHNIDTIVVGDDYKDKAVVGSQFARSTVFFSKVPGFSSSLIYEQYSNQ